MIRGHRFLILIIWLAAVTAGSASLWSGTGIGLDRFLREVRDSIRQRPGSGEIVIVEIDAKSLKAIDRWPWPRRYHGQLVERLHAAGARTIGFDVDFSAPSSATDDAQFAAALAKAGGSVILPTFRQPIASGKSDFLENVPIPELRGHGFLASVNVHPDGDGQVRTYHGGVETAGKTRPSLAAVITEHSGQSVDAFPIDTAIDPASIPRLSFSDVVAGAFPRDVVKGKRVIVGATAIELGDRYAMPGQGVIPGVVIQAMAAETLIAGRGQPSLGGLPLLMVSLVVAFGALKRRSSKGRAAWFAGSAAAILVAPLATEAGRLGMLDAVPAIAVLLVAAALSATLSIATAFRARLLTDADTGLPNLRALNEARASDGGFVVTARLARYGDTLAVLGPVATGELVSRAAERLAIHADAHRIFRVREDTLAWLVFQTDHELADSIEGLAALFRSPIALPGRAIEVNLAFGAAIATDNCGVSAAKAILASDHAAANGLRWTLHNEALGAEVDWRLALLGEFDSAIADGQFWVAYQPKASMQSGEIIGAEALVRWNHPVRGLVPPDHFIPVIEPSRHILDLSLFVLNRALDDQAEWRAAGLDLSVAVNVSTPLLDEPRFAKHVADALKRTGVNPAKLTLEITESAALADADRAVAAMEALRALGVQLSIDDYGTGQSTLSYLKRLPASEIKIDKSFVQNLPDSHNDRILVRSTIELAHELNFKVVAEGIEDLACLELLRTFGCDVAQGWHIGRPMPSAQLMERLLDRTELAA